MENEIWKDVEAFDTIELERNQELSQKYQLSKITGKEKTTDWFLFFRT